MAVFNTAHIDRHLNALVDDVAVYVAVIQPARVLDAGVHDHTLLYCTRYQVERAVLDGLALLIVHIERDTKMRLLW
jgi:hypothetical protein